MHHPCSQNCTDEAGLSVQYQDPVQVAPHCTSRHMSASGTRAGQQELRQRSCCASDAELGVLASPSALRSAFCCGSKLCKLAHSQKRTCARGVRCAPFMCLPGPLPCQISDADTQLNVPCRPEQHTNTSMQRHHLPPTTPWKRLHVRLKEVDNLATAPVDCVAEQQELDWLRSHAPARTCPQPLDPCRVVQTKMQCAQP